MNTILYIKDSFCLSADTLRGWFAKAAMDSSIYEELLTLYLDGVLEHWLEDGTLEERKMAHDIHEIPLGLTNRDAMERLMGIFTQSKVVVKKPAVNGFVEFLSFSYRQAGDERLLPIGKDTVFVSSKEDTVKLVLRVKVRQVDNEALNIRILNNGQVIPVRNLCLKEQKKGQELEIPIVLKLYDDDLHVVRLLCDDELWAEARFQLQTKVLEENGVMTVYPTNDRKLFFKMRKVEGGTFMMGATHEQASSSTGEHPAHRVTLDSYYIGVTPVTQELWQAVMKDNPSCFKEKGRPVESVSWDDCQEFIKKLNVLTGLKFRLPTEAQWEYAARGGNKSGNYRYAGGNAPQNVAWFEGNSGRCTHNVGTRQPNELGIYDMSGNVWEWCQDWYDREYYNCSPEMNPEGPSSGSVRVNRGGSWYNTAASCRCANRDFYSPSGTSIFVGFRLAL